MPTLLSYPCCTVTVDPAKGILRFVRTEVPYDSLEDIVDLHERIGRIFDRMGRDRHLLLVDMRRAQLNNKPDFERAAARARAFLVRDFSRVAVLVQTAVGMLQVRRHMREDGVPGDVFDDEAEALAYLARAELGRQSGSTKARRAAGEHEPDEAAPTSAQRLKDGPFSHLARRTAKR